MSDIRPTTWRGLAAWELESSAVRAVVVPEMGAKIVSLRDKRSGFEWLVGPIPGRPVRPVAYPAPFERQDMAGWDEMFPTIVACAYPGPGPHQGTALPDHGEAWQLPWEVIRCQGELALTLTGRALPYRLTRAASLAAPDVLCLQYTLENLGSAPMPYLWAAHPQFVAGPGCRVMLPPQVTEVVNTIPAEWGWGPPETRLTWPEAAMPDGRRERLDESGPATLHRGRKLFALPEARPSWAALRREDLGHWLCMEWNPAEVPYLGLWVDEGAVHCETVAAPEPGTGWYDSLALAWQKGRVCTVPAGGTRRWTLTVRLGTRGDPFAPPVCL